MFKRRISLTYLQKAKEALWPSMGWVRAFHYLKHRMVRLDDTSRKIAAGLALGTALSFSPLMGTHIIQVAIIGYILRFNIVAGLVGTAVGNPWTFPLIWWASYSLGAYIFGLFGWHGEIDAADLLRFSSLWELITTQSAQILWPWMLGGYLMGLLIWFPAYIFYYNLIKAARLARERVRRRRMNKAAGKAAKTKKAKKT